MLLSFQGPIPVFEVSSSSESVASPILDTMMGEIFSESAKLVPLQTVAANEPFPREATSCSPQRKTTDTRANEIPPANAVSPANETAVANADRATDIVQPVLQPVIPTETDPKVTIFILQLLFVLSQTLITSLFDRFRRTSQ